MDMTLLITGAQHRVIFAGMFRYFISVILISIMLVQCFSDQFVQLDYYLDTVAFAKNCVNKARPAMHCNGKCQMMKKIQQQEKKDEQVPVRRGENKNEVLSSKSFFCVIEISLRPTKNKYPQRDYSVLSKYSPSIFQPPQELTIFSV